MNLIVWPRLKNFDQDFSKRCIPVVSATLCRFSQEVRKLE